MADLVLYHGGLKEPVCCAIPEGTKAEFLARVAEFPRVSISDADLSTVYRWGDGGLTPLNGPMDSKTFNQVLEEQFILHDGKKYAWTIPLSLPLTEELAKSLKVGQEVALVNSRGDIVGSLEINDIFPWDKAKYLRHVYRTDRTDHPGADMVLVQDADKTWLLGGKIHVLPQLKNPSFGKYILSPRKTRALIAEKGWERVVAFQTRNPLHRAHEYALVYGLETLLREGLNAGACLNPLVGETKGDDVNATIRMDTYEMLINDRVLGEGDSDNALWKKIGESVPDRVILLGLDIKMFYGGPSEAVMHAIYRQNFGFTDIIIGRKHADAPYHDGTPIWGDFDAQEIFNNLAGDLQEKPLNVGFAAYYESAGRVDLMENHPNEKPVFISGKEVRATLLRGEIVDPRIMRPGTSAILAAAMQTVAPAQLGLVRWFWIGTILTAVSFFLSMSVFAQKGSKPTFTQYEMPEVVTPLPVITDWLVNRNYWMLGIGLTLLITSTIVAIRWRSRRMILLNAIVAVATLGFAFGGCPCPIGAIQNVAVALTNSQYLLPWTIAVLFFAPLFMTLLFGRTFCASACPIGALQELVAVRPMAVPRSVDDLLGMFRFIFLGAVILWATMGLPFLACRFDPAIALFRGGTGWGIFLIWSIAILLLGIVIARPYCRWLCPYGAILQLCGRLAIWRVQVTPGDCSRCRLCETICPYNAIIPPSQPPTFAERRIGVAKFSRAIIAFPLFLLVFGFGGWLLSFPLAQSHPIVKQAELVYAEETGLVDYLGAFDETLAHYRTQEENEALYRRAAVIAGRFRWATTLFGIWVGAVLGGTLIVASTRRKCREYIADPGKCFACGRCFWYCPNQKQDRYFLEQP